MYECNFLLLAHLIEIVIKFENKIFRFLLFSISTENFLISL